MRILSITAQKPHSTGSGIYLSALVRAFAHMGIEQAVAGGVYADDTVTFPDGVRFYPVVFGTEELPFAIPGMSDEMPYPSTQYRSMDDDTAGRFLAAFMRRIRPAVEEFRPDLILCHHLYLLTAMVREEFPGATVFGISHNTDLRQLSEHGRFRDFIIPRIAALDGIFALHEGQRAQIARTFSLPPERIATAGSGYDGTVFRPAPGALRDPARLCFAGKISEKKGVFSLIRALSLIPSPPPSLRLTLAGGYANADHARALELIGGCPFPVSLTGALSQTDLARLFSECGVFVLPSFYEGLPLVLTEALSCGAKAVCTDLPGVREWMDANAPGHGIRFVAPPKMQGADTPLPSSLEGFESRLALAISEELCSPPRKIPDLTHLSFRSVAARLLREYNKTQQGGC